MNHLWFDEFNNLWRTPVDWGTRPPPRIFPVIYVDPARRYYARWEGREQTHTFELQEGVMSPKLVEEFRMEPELFFQEAQ